MGPNKCRIFSARSSSTLWRTPVSTTDSGAKRGPFQNTFSAVGNESACANIVATAPDEPVDPRRESIRTLDEDSGRAAKELEVCRGLRGISALTAGVESERGAWEGTELDVCKGPRGTTLLAEGVESERGAWEGTEPDVCSGLRGTMLLAEGVESERVAWEETESEVRRGLRVESRLSSDC